MPFGINLPGITWNSWYNPLDNAANAVKSVGNGVANTVANSSPLTNTPASELNFGKGGVNFGSSTANSFVNGVLGAQTSTPSGSVPVGNVGESQPTGSGSATYGGSTASTDPYAQYGGKAAYDSLVSGFDTQKQNIFGTANDAATNAGIGINSSILDLLDSFRTGQQAIDQRGVKNELAKQQGTRGVLEMVGRGIRSGGVQLANRNAGDSSAAGAIANAYGDIGQRSLSGIGNQYEMGNQDIGLAQTELTNDFASKSRKIGENKQQVVNNIVADARNKFSELDAAMAGKSLPQRIAIEQEKETVRQQVLAKLQQYDQQLATEGAKIQPTSTGDRRSEASRLGALGTDLGADAFDFTDEVPSQFQNTGPFSSDLPIFTFPRGTKQFA